MTTTRKTKDIKRGVRPASKNKSKNNYESIREVIEHIVANKFTQESLDDLAKSLGVSPGHIQKIFTKWVGITPKQFGRYMSLQYSKGLLADSKSMVDTTVKSGLSSPGRLYDLFVDIEAMTPGEYQNQGRNLVIHYSTFDSQFGLCLVASTSRGVCNVLFADGESQAVADLKSRWPEAKLTKKREEFHSQIQDYFKNLLTSASTGSKSGQKTKSKSKIKLHLHGTNFQVKVWEALLSIPEGEIATYGTLAKKIVKSGGEKKSKNAAVMSRAVGNAVGSNPVGFIIPCHRVLKSTGEIGGYHWGSERKRAMLGYEAVRKNEK